MSVLTVCLRCIFVQTNKKLFSNNCYILSSKCFDDTRLSMMYLSMIKFPSKSKELQLLKIQKTLFFAGHQLSDSQLENYF